MAHRAFLCPIRRERHIRLELKTYKPQPCGPALTTFCCFLAQKHLTPQQYPCPFLRPLFFFFHSFPLLPFGGSLAHKGISAQLFRKCRLAYFRTYIRKNYHMTLYKPPFTTLALNCPSLFPLFPQPGSKWWLNRLLERERKKKDCEMEQTKY